MGPVTPLKSGLPIDAILERATTAILDSGGLVLTAEPGAGKTTRLPVALLDVLDGKILVVEPRRVAARLAAEYVSAQRGERTGETVGYVVRDDDKTGPDTRLIYLTGGVLMRRITHDPTLVGVCCVIFDEFHERHLHDDLLLAWLRKRSGVHLVIMSATLNAEPIARWLNVPWLHAEGRVFPVEIEYQRPGNFELSVRVVRALKTTTAGDVLVFLPGVRAIERCANAAAALARQDGLELIPLHASLGAAGIRKALAPRHGVRRVLLSTNIAESSITLDGVLCVIDSGEVKTARSSRVTGLTELLTIEAPRDSLDQRAGRAGRTAPGRCIRLFDEASYRSRAEARTPEIARADLANAALTLAALGVAALDELDWLEAPDHGRFEDARRLLHQLGALQGDQLTTDGSAMLRMPLHPRLARLVLTADSLGIPRTGRIAAAILSEVRRLPDYLSGRDRECDVTALVRAFEDGRLGREVDAAVRRLRPGRAKERLDGRALRQAMLTAHPDLIARIGGTRVLLPGSTPLALGRFTGVSELTADWIVIGRARQGRVEIASAVDVDQLYDLPGAEDALDEAIEAEWDSEKQRVSAHHVLRFRGMTLERTPIQARGTPEADALLKKHASAAGLSRFTDAKALAVLQARTKAAHVGDASVPHLDDQVVQDTLHAICEGSVSFAEIKRADLLGMLRARLSFRQRKRLEELAPTRITLASGRQATVLYPAEGAPRISAPVQWFLGMAEGPRIGGQYALLELLAPNRLPLQLTDDLAGFWKRTWPQIRKELRGRYAKHPWPEDPLKPAR